MGGVFSEEAERPEEAPDVDEEATEQTPVAPAQIAQEGGVRRRRRQTHHRSRAGNSKRKTIRNRTRE